MYLEEVPNRTEKRSQVFFEIQIEICKRKGKKDHKKRPVIKINKNTIFFCRIKEFVVINECFENQILYPYLFLRNTTVVCRKK